MIHDACTCSSYFDACDPCFSHIPHVSCREIRNLSQGPRSSLDRYAVHLTGEDPKCGTLDATTGSGWQGRLMILTRFTTDKS